MQALGAVQGAYRGLLLAEPAARDAEALEPGRRRGVVDARLERSRAASHSPAASAARPASMRAPASSRATACSSIAPSLRRAGPAKPASAEHRIVDA
jgi:hypothetical protein